MREETGLKLAASTRKAMDEIGRDRRFRIETRGGVSAAGAQVDGINIQLRPFFNVLHAAGNEAAIFDEIVTNEKKQGRDFLADIPPSQHRPILRIDWSNVPGLRLPPLVSVRYFGKDYEITDLADPIEHRTYNRDVFYMLIALYNQVQFDPGKLPAQQLIQVR